MSSFALEVISYDFDFLVVILLVFLVFSVSIRGFLVCCAVPDYFLPNSFWSLMKYILFYVLWMRLCFSYIYNIHLTFFCDTAWLLILALIFREFKTWLTILYFQILKYIISYIPGFMFLINYLILLWCFSLCIWAGYFFSHLLVFALWLSNCGYGVLWRLSLVTSIWVSKGPLCLDVDFLKFREISSISYLSKLSMTFDFISAPTSSLLWFVSIERTLWNDWLF